MVKIIRILPWPYITHFEEMANFKFCAKATRMSDPNGDPNKSPRPTPRVLLFDTRSSAVSVASVNSSSGPSSRVPRRKAMNCSLKKAITIFFEEASGLEGEICVMPHAIQLSLPQLVVSCCDLVLDRLLWNQIVSPWIPRCLLTEMQTFCAFCVFAGGSTHTSDNNL